MCLMPRSMRAKRKRDMKSPLHGSFINMFRCVGVV